MLSPTTEQMLNDPAATGALTSEQVGEIVDLVADDGLADELVASILENCAPEWDDGVELPPGELPMRVGAWRLDMGKAAVRSGLISSIVAASLVQQGMAQMVVGVVAAVIPTVLDVQRVELSAADHSVLVDLRVHEDVRTGKLSADELYARLPTRPVRS